MYKKLEMDLTNITKEGFKKIKLLKPFQFLLENIDSSSEKRIFSGFYDGKVSPVYGFINDPWSKGNGLKPTARAE
jgi:hypothetical protein